jgi:hypothetical protein
MDWPTAVAVAVPLGTLIIAAEKLMERSKKGSNGNGSKQPVTRDELDKILENRMKGVVYSDTCHQVQMRMDASFKSMKEYMILAFEDLKQEIRKQ